MYKEKFFYLCKVPLSAEGPSDVIIVTRAEDSTDFPRVFAAYEESRKHAFNDDGLYSVIRADEINLIIRTNTTASAKELAFEEATTELVTNLQHRVMQKKDEHAQTILKNVHGIELAV